MMSGDEGFNPLGHRDVESDGSPIFSGSEVRTTPEIAMALERIILPQYQNVLVALTNKKGAQQKRSQVGAWLDAKGVFVKDANIAVDALLGRLAYQRDHARWTAPIRVNHKLEPYLKLFPFLDPPRSTEDKLLNTLTVNRVFEAVIFAPISLSSLETGDQTIPSEFYTAALKRDTQYALPIYSRCRVPFKVTELVNPKHTQSRLPKELEGELDTMNSFQNSKFLISTIIAAR